MSDGSHGWRQSGMCVCDRQKLTQAAATGEGRRVAVDALKETNQVCAYADPHVCFYVVTCPHWVDEPIYLNMFISLSFVEKSN
jgi:hypothetical protein